MNAKWNASPGGPPQGRRAGSCVRLFVRPENLE